MVKADGTLDGPSRPPLPPESAWRKPWLAYGVYFGLGATLYLACIGLEASLFWGSPIADWLAFAAGVFALTILNFQHEILHIHGDGLDGAEEDAWLNLTSLVTGMNAQQWQTHYSHHAFTGDYQGQLIQKRSAKPSQEKPELLSDGSIDVGKLVDKDLDDYIGLLRRDGMLRSFTRLALPLRALITTLPFLITIPAFHLLMVGISTYRALSQHQWLQALLPGLGLGLLVALTGVRCALITSVVFSTMFMVHIAAFHIPTSAEGKGYSYWQQQVLQTRNLAHARSPIMRIVTWYGSYHLGHHLWPKVPIPNLPELEALARGYASQWNLPEEEQEQSLASGLKLWIQEAWSLAGVG
ncbi:fatty acid desaturase family protein [Synechococcus sp. SYN20]|uniref:fatty acid desaturase n=1 Tax=Synechococcus sp. SYN20 TaxID=1050714 RepID=UPI000CA33595|nr:fatty acid desaturase [Synechococcus sp. SYN20]ATV95737.1 fatty acid desaturase family protein [Synechococcus sp. SYN20]QNJ25359.1 fatty acid desaturase family protein [Synechococcus sp. SYN20]